MILRKQLILAALAGLVFAPAPGAAQTPGDPGAMKKLTPVLVVDDIEPCLPFWTERLGFERTVEVPEGEDGERLGFVALARDGVGVMFQTLKSLEDDVPEALDSARGSRGFLFVEVEDVAALDRLEAVLQEAGDPMVVPRRTTFYGADEVIVRDPCGNVVALAAFPEGG